MIRPTLSEDTPSLLRLAERTGVFKPPEIVALREVLDDLHATNHALGHRSITYEAGATIAGFAYFAPAAMTDRTWHLYWIAVEKATQSQGIGGQLLVFLEAEIRRLHGRQMLIETSSLPHYDPTRRFYLKHGYESAAVVPDYYAAGDHMVIFRKRFE
ncbi:MAG TPA: GNAT family N-acetyltransferase [Pirellulales bacterium]|jgi:ribosomal protein S18 acetylase RimI-like enzyme|nr:GNAT family N-acetyltransferase [Pirellulales bacterium]